MLAVKIFDEEHESDLEASVNEFIQSLDPRNEIKDIQFRVAVAEDSSGDQIFCFSAMVVYQMPVETSRVERKRNILK
ncbi:MAG: sporulation protein Cse60 [Tuberibacillus sp.]